MSDWLGLAGRRAVVTGAGSGIGQAVAVALAAVGVEVIGVDRDAESLRDSGLRAEICDISSESAVKALKSENISKFDLVMNSPRFLKSSAIQPILI